MLAPWAYLAILLFIAYILYRVFSNIKVVVALVLALTCAYYLSNYMLKGADMSDSNIIKTVMHYDGKINNAINSFDAYFERLEKIQAKDDFLTGEIVKKRRAARIEDMRKTQELWKEKQQQQLLKHQAIDKRLDAIQNGKY